MAFISFLLPPAPLGMLSSPTEMVSLLLTLSGTGQIHFLGPLCPLELIPSSVFSITSSVWYLLHTAQHGGVA